MMESTTLSWQKQKQPWFLPPPGRSAVDQLENNHLEDFKIYWSELMILQIRLIREWLPDFLTTALMVVVVVASLNIVQTLNWWVAKLNLKAASHDVIQILATAKGWVKKRGLALTHNYVNPNEFCDFNNYIVWYSPVFEVIKMRCNISVGQGTEFIRPDIVESWSQPLFFWLTL